MKNLIGQALLGLTLSLAGMSCSSYPVESVFKDPSDQVQTSVYWYWISGNISEEGVKKDLYAMKEAGINRAFIGSMGVDGIETPYNKVAFGS